jgi:hypothetical protein
VSETEYAAGLGETVVDPSLGPAPSGAPAWLALGAQFKPVDGVTVIGFGHKARHGKDTAVAAIVTAIPGAMRFSFADDLYAVCRVLHGMTTKDAPLLQKVGLGMRETVDPAVWIKAVYAKILEHRPRIALISDVRFPNEMAFVKALGGTTVKVERRNERGGLFIDPSRPADHPSETALDDAEWDVTLTNDSSVEALQMKARKLALVLSLMDNALQSVQA